MKHPKCLNCKEHGHWARECPKDRSGYNRNYQVDALVKIQQKSGLSGANETTLGKRKAKDNAEDLMRETLDQEQLLKTSIIKDSEVPYEM